MGMWQGDVGEGGDPLDASSDLLLDHHVAERAAHNAPLKGVLDGGRHSQNRYDLCA